MTVASVIAAQRTDHGVPHAKACRWLEVKPSTFYKWLDRPPTANIRIDQGTTQARNVVLAQTPDSLSLTAGQLVMLCMLGGSALCAAGHLVPGILLSWFKADVRNRSDFGGDLSSARQQADCFAWTAVPARNFTTKPPGNSGCR